MTEQTVIGWRHECRVFIGDGPGGASWPAVVTVRTHDKLMPWRAATEAMRRASLDHVKGRGPGPVLGARFLRADPIYGDPDAS